MVIFRGDLHTSGFRGAFREIGSIATMARRIRPNTVQTLRPKKNESFSRWGSSVDAGTSHE